MASVTFSFGKTKKYAWVKGGGSARRIYHAGMITGEDGDKVWLSGHGIKSYPCHGMWVPKNELILLADANGIERHPSSIAGKKSKRNGRP